MAFELGGKKKSGGKLVGALAMLLLVGALGAAGWRFQEPIKQLAQRFFPDEADDAAEFSTSPTISPAEGAPPENTTVAPDSTATTTSGSVFNPNEKSSSATPPVTAAAPIDQATTPQESIQPAKPAGSPDAGTTSTTNVPAEVSKPVQPADPPATLPMPVAPKAEIVVDNASTVTPDSPSTKIGAVKMAETSDPGKTPNPLIEVAPPVPPPPTEAQQPPTITKASGSALVKTSPEAAPAVDALKSFFEAGNLGERIKFTLGAESLRPLMERYYAKTLDGPIQVDEISLLRYDPAPQTGTGAHAVFTVGSKLWEYPIPVMLQEEKGTFLVDWLAFVEFKDNLLFKFLSEWQDMPARFHVGIRRTHYFEDDVPDLDAKDCFEIQPPLPTYVGFVFVPKDAKLAGELATKIGWETRTAYVIVELRWRQQDGFKWVEMTGVPQLNWYSFPTAIKPVAEPAPAKSKDSAAGSSSAPMKVSKPLKK